MPDEDEFGLGGAVMLAMRRAWAAEDRPMTAHLDITWRCDLDCQHCYLDQKDSPELTTAEWHNVIDQVADAGVLTVVWSGGEVTLRPDFLELLEHAARRNLLSRVKTHAGNLDAAWVEHLRKNRTAQVDVSVYSLDPQVHDTFTRRPGSLAATIAGIRATRQAGIPVRVAVYVLAHAIDEIPSLAKYFGDLGCEVGFSTKTQRDQSATTALDVLELEGELLLRARTLISQVSRSAKRPATLPQHGQADPCQAGRSLAYVSPDGQVWPCVTFPMPFGSLREQPFAAIWHESPVRKALTAWNNGARTACQTCAGSGFCSYCPGAAYKITGDFRQAPGAFHNETRARMRAHELVHGDTFSADEWATVPEISQRPAAAKRFVFPIHRATRSGGARIKPKAT